MASGPDTKPRKRRSGGWRLRMLIAAVIVFGTVLILVSNVLLTARFTDATRTRADDRMQLYVTALTSTLQRHEIIPQLLALDRELIRALEDRDYSLSTARLLSFEEEIRGAALTLMDLEGRVVAATDRNRLGENLRNSPVFVDALRSPTKVFTIAETDGMGFDLIYSRRITGDTGAVGVIAIQVDLASIVQGWAGVNDAVFVTDSEGRIILSTERRWLGLDEPAAIARQSVPSSISRALRATTSWAGPPADAYLEGQAVMRRDVLVPFQGWRMVSYTTYASVRERVNTVLAIELTGIAALLAVIFWMASRRTASRANFLQRESAELRALNDALQREIAERQKVEKDLQVAEQTVEQTSKLAALGEMSAAVSHELNQPLAAMRTYLAGARLLLQRRRPDEALSSFDRIDDLIARMGAITQQLKSYARKGSDRFSPVDTGAAVQSALSLMEPQLRTRHVEIRLSLPDKPVEIYGDRLRLEQVIINLLRNALDATKSVSEPRVDVILAQGETVTLTVRDNGKGIADPDSLFEPFYTTKEPGDGVGLGLAISSGIVNDLGGRLTARPAANGGAVFEVQLPVYQPGVAAAE